MIQVLNDMENTARVLMRVMATVAFELRRTGADSVLDRPYGPNIRCLWIDSPSLSLFYQLILSRAFTKYLHLMPHVLARHMKLLWESLETGIYAGIAGNLRRIKYRTSCHARKERGYSRTRMLVLKIIKGMGLRDGRYLRSSQASFPSLYKKRKCLKGGKSVSS